VWHDSVPLPNIPAFKNLEQGHRAQQISHDYMMIVGEKKLKEKD
jgi:hypothetical protein